MYSYSDILYQCIFASYLWLSGEHINVYILLCQVIYVVCTKCYIRPCGRRIGPLACAMMKAARRDRNKQAVHQRRSLPLSIVRVLVDTTLCTHIFTIIICMAGVFVVSIF